MSCSKLYLSLTEAISAAINYQILCWESNILWLLPKASKQSFHVIEMQFVREYVNMLCMY